MLRHFYAAAIVALFLTGMSAQTPSGAGAVRPNAALFPPAEISGMYSFTRDGEFVQVSVDDEGHVTGFVSRFGDLDSDRGVFLDQFFKTASLNSDKLAFTTEPVHGTWFEFRGQIVRDPAKQVGQEGYYVLRGTLTQFVSDANKRITSRSRALDMKLFPRDEAPGPVKHD